MKRIFILLAMFAFVGLSTDVMAQEATKKEAKATKVSLSSAKKDAPKAACCASAAKKSCAGKAEWRRSAHRKAFDYDAAADDNSNDRKSTRKPSKFIPLPIRNSDE